MKIRPAVIWGSLCVLLLDQVTKYAVRQSLALGESIPVIPPIFSLTHVTNYGIGFGLLQNMVPFVVAASVVIILGLGYYVKSFPNKPLISFCFALLWGGSLGNLIDRLYFGYVTDFLNFHIWPVFNIADSAISIGGVVLLFWLYRKE